MIAIPTSTSWPRGSEVISLGDKSQLDVAMIGTDLSTHGVAILTRFSMEVLVTADASQRLHGSHPEVIGIRPDDTE